MRKRTLALGGISLLLGASTLALQAYAIEPTTPPDPPKFEAQQAPNFVGVGDIQEYRALDSDTTSPTG